MNIKVKEKEFVGSLRGHERFEQFLLIAED